MCTMKTTRKTLLLFLEKVKEVPKISIIAFLLLHTQLLLAQDCAGKDWNDPVNKSTLIVSATVNTSGSISVLLDDNLGNNSFYYPDAPIASLEVLRITFPEADILTGLEYGIGDSYMFNSGATIKIQGSNDAISWVDMVPVSEGTSPSLVINGNTYAKDRNLGNNHVGILSTASHTERMFWTNTTSYTYYRILGVSGNMNQNPWINELYFQTLDGFEVNNLSCGDNGTTEVFSDDELNFDFTALRGTGNYTVSIDGGFTITPTTGTFGQSSSFTVSSGSSGAGDLTLTLTDAIAGCTTSVLIPNSINECVPGACGERDWNDPIEKINVAGDFHIPGTGATDGPLAVLVDSNNSSGVGAKNNNYSNTATFTANFPEPTVLTGIEVVVTTDGQGGPISSAVVRVEGSNDGITYVDLSGDLTLGTDFNLGTPQYGTGANAYTFLCTANTTAYSYYRIYSVSMATQFGPDFMELYFGYNFFDPQLTNQNCGDNGTSEDYTDDLVTFDLNPIPGIAGNTYSVEVDGGFTITPSIGVYGQTTSFTISSGSSGAGDLNVSFYDANVPCFQTIVISNEDNACIPGPCGGLDWNVASTKSTLSGDFHIPGTGATDGPLAVLVDSNNDSGVGSKNNNYANQATFTVNFSEATVLHGMEIVINPTNNGPITAGVMRVEGSNDGVNFTAISVDFTLGTNLNVGAPQYGSGTQAYTFPFADNTTAYSTYRLYSTSMSTRFGRKFNELYFDYDVYNANVTNISFGDNETSGIFDDDVLNFELNPSPGSGNYSVQYVGDFSISPPTAVYGTATNFQISEGSAGTGDISILLLDTNVPCVQEVILPNPDLTANVVSTQAACITPVDNPVSTITITAEDDVYTKAEYNIGTVYAGLGYGTATDITNASSGFDLVNTLPNPDFKSYYTVRAYATETLYRDYVVSVIPKTCSVVDLSLTVSPETDSANTGENLTYVVTLTNAGPDPAVNVEVKVDIPLGLELLSTTPSVGDYSAATQLWTADLLPVGTHQLSITYRMN